MFMTRTENKTKQKWWRRRSRLCYMRFSQNCDGHIHWSMEKNIDELFFFHRKSSFSLDHHRAAWLNQSNTECPLIENVIIIYSIRFMENYEQEDYKIINSFPTLINCLVGASIALFLFWVNIFVVLLDLNGYYFTFRSSIFLRSMRDRWSKKTKHIHTHTNTRIQIGYICVARARTPHTINYCIIPHCYEIMR